MGEGENHAPCSLLHNSAASPNNERPPKIARKIEMSIELDAKLGWQASKKTCIYLIANRALRGFGLGVNLKT
jgi:hypothetical protein